ncbi:uncharacterized protein LOC119189644 [Manduca sexta]|uniref:uncharacterized protein LOC119189644 n=1 Tax=Manduca sexta TaxID=7130 RepID=UPI00188E3AB3|nr:uncharacterized protein LOC119189644 [Manduca sexta]
MVNVGLTSKPKVVNDTILGQTRRILGGHEVGDTRPYMVYLRPASSADPHLDPNWLCGGVIIHERYILTSAACIEDVKQFYVVSGTHRWVPLDVKNDECINNGAKKAVWKCVPKSYFFDGNDFDNIRWMVDDIAVVKVEDDFNFYRRVRGCDFIPKKIAYNNESEEFEKPGTTASTAGWGSLDNFGDSVLRAAVNSPVLLESDVMVISKRNCKRRWDARYHYIIDSSMICTKDSQDTDVISRVCSEHEVNCKDLVYSDEDEDNARRRLVIDSNDLQLHTAVHSAGTRRSKGTSGGFCENDHGGPLVSGQGKSAMVIGVVSACMTKHLTNKCYGPFLFTSVYKNRNIINCAINKDLAVTCRKLLRSSKTQLFETVFNWSSFGRFVLYAYLLRIVCTNVMHLLQTSIYVENYNQLKKNSLITLSSE